MFKPQNSRCLIFLALFSLAPLWGCSGAKNDELLPLPARPPIKNKIGQIPVEVLGEKGSLQFTADGVEGVGRLRVREPIKYPRSAQNFQLSFYLEPRGELTFYSYSNSSLKNGLEFHFVRVSDTGQLKAFVRSDKAVQDISESFKSLDATQAIWLSIDVHNDHQQKFHALLWGGGADEVLTEILLDGFGRGAYWGFDLQSARIFNMGLSNPRNKHNE